MVIINAKVDDKLVKEFRHVIYNRHGLKKGDFKNALEEAMLDYIRKYSEKGSDIDRLAQTAKTVPDNQGSSGINGSIEEIYAELTKLNVNVKEIRNMNPTQAQLKDLLEGLKKLRQ